MINTREVASFINDVIIETKEEKEYNEVVEEVVRRLIENDLYIKLEKCKWKIVTYYPSIFDTSDYIMDNNYLSFTLSKTSVEVDILLLVYILLLVQINLFPFYVGLLYY